VERGLRLLLRPVRRWLVPTPAAMATPQKLLGRFWIGLRRAGMAVCHLILDLIPVGGFAAIGNLLLGTALVANGTAHQVILTAINAYLLVRVVLCVVRMVVAPGEPGWRLVQMSDHAAGAAVAWTRVLAGIAVFGITAVNLAVALGLDPSAALALQKLVMLVDHVLLVAVVVRCREAVAARIRPAHPGRDDAWHPLAQLRQRLAAIWHIVAIILIMALWLVWAADLQGGYTRMLRIVFVTAAVLIVARLLTNGALHALDHMTQHVPGTDHAGRARLVHYLGLLRRLVRTVVALIAAVALLQLWGADAVSWVDSTPLGRQLISATLTIGVTLLLAVAAWEGANITIEQHLARLTREAQLPRIARLRTLLPILRTALLITILLVVAMTALSEIGVNVAPLLAGAGILGVAIGFGSQKLVQDFITGIFLLLENAMQVGDFVTLAGVSGSVEHLSIRTIRLRAGDGSVHIIPFSSVTMVNNTNRGLGNAAVSVTVSSREDTDAVGEALKQIVREMREDEAFSRTMLSDLQLWGVDKIDGASATLVGQIVCTDSGRWGVQRELNRRVKKRFAELGIQIPTATQTVLLAEARPAQAAAPAGKGGDDPGETTATVQNSPPPSSLGHSE
jgi:small-conductance mechanosensitive channel